MKKKCFRSPSSTPLSHFWKPTSTAKKFLPPVIVLGTLFSLIPVRVSTQEHSGPIPTLRSASRLVVIPTIVRSTSDDFVSGLTPRDFIVRDDGTKQAPLVVEQASNQPLAVVLVMQTGGTAYRNFQQYLSIARLLKGAPVQRVALVTFDSKPEEIWAFPLLSDGVFSAMDTPQPGDAGASILDAVNQAADLLQGEPSEVRRLVLLLSQPRDSGSTMLPLQFLKRLGQMDAPIYSFTFPSRALPKDAAAERSCLAADKMRLVGAATTSMLLSKIRTGLCRNTAAELAMVSGGEHLLIKSQDDLDRSTSLLSQALANGYTLSFQPTSPSPGFHILAVQAGTKGARLAVASRGLYWLP